MTNHTLDKAIYEKYIKPTQRKRTRTVGVEIELPIVNEEEAPVDFEVIHALTDAFVDQFQFEVIRRDDSGEIYSAASLVTGDDISYDCSYNTLELSFGILEDINELDRRFREYIVWIQNFLEPYHHLVTGMGINPRYNRNLQEPVPNGRYRMLFHHLKSYTRYEEMTQFPFHHNPDFGLYSCASQVQMDVEEEMIPEVLYTFSMIEPLKAVLFSNSLWGDSHETLCGRDGFWKYSLHGINPHNVDMYNVELSSTEELIEYIKTMSIFCVERGDRYLNFEPVPLQNFFDGRKITAEYYDGNQYRTMKITPDISDISWLRSYKFVDVTFRGTVEFRSICNQPLKDAMAPAAFHAGLMEPEILTKLTELMKEDHVLYHHGYNPTELREMFAKRAYPEWVKPEELTALLEHVLDLALEGLKMRGMGEEHYLMPLYKRAKNLSNPARMVADGLDAGEDMDLFIREFAKLD